jgi:hypothetical protein
MVKFSSKRIKKPIKNVFSVDLSTNSVNTRIGLSVICTFSVIFVELFEISKTFILKNEFLNRITLNIPEKILEIFEPITLDEMNGVKLLDRMDKKFTFSFFKLEDILKEASKFYRILVVNDLRYAHYETRYYDTPGFEMYIKHHNNKLNRNKVRFRTYLDSGIHFFEVKFKTNKGRTIKKRVSRDVDDYSINGNAEELLKKGTPYPASALQEAIRVFYTRITLVSNDLKERLTIDLDLHFDHNGIQAGYPGMVIAEVKQDKSGNSPFIEIMKEKRIIDVSISKYCLGIASTVPNIKTNNFKIKINYVNKLCNTTA